MSGLEVVALVAGIVSAFSGTASFLTERKKRKAEKHYERKKELKTLRKAVVSAPPQIQHEYDRDFARIGPRFAVGDAIAQNQLTRILIGMQQDMIDKLQRLVFSASSNSEINYRTLLNISNQSTLESISTLTEQYQRFSTAAPVTRHTFDVSSAGNTPQFCPGALALKRSNAPVPWSWRCPSCGVPMTAWGPKIPTGIGEPESPPAWATGCKGMSGIFSYTQHLPASCEATVVYRQCTICWEHLGVVSEKMTLDEWLWHVNWHITLGGFELCLDEEGDQVRRALCGKKECGKIHSRG